MAILEKITSSKQVQKLNISELETLSGEIRSSIISATNAHGGHLSANLGIVETTVALYHTFNFPEDKIVFDVGHQCYTHKILSGRKEDFSSIRSCGGLSGFPCKEESEYDVFTTGHAGASISSCLGLCEARDKLGEDYTVIAVVGDGSIVNGLNFEAITASNVKPKNLIVILNDNGMSISKNKNGFYKFISEKSLSRSYLKSKRNFKKVFKESIFTKFARKTRGLIKRIFNKGKFFEQYGFKYVGVVDGNDINEMVRVLKKVKYVAKDKAVFLHVSTLKGKGDKNAEERSDVYHGVGKENKSVSGEYGLSLASSLNALIEKDDKIVALTAGMKDGTGLSHVEEIHPKNVIDVGIAEEYAVTLASGMATGGLKPVVCVYSTFLQRAYDQIMHDVCLQNLPVVFCIDRAGLIGEDGKTHQGVFDISYLSHMPNMTVLSVCSPKEIKDALLYAFSLKSPVAIRYPKGKVSFDSAMPFDSGKWVLESDCENAEKVVLAVGPNMLNLAFEYKNLIKEPIAIYNVRSIKPLDEKVLNSLKGKKIITLEENAVTGGFGSAVSSFFSTDTDTRVYNFGVVDEFIKHGTIDSQMEFCGLTAQNIKDKVK